MSESFCFLWSSIDVRGLLSGLYPAIVISRPKPAIELKNGISGFRSSNWLRKNLVVVQFVISTIIVIAAIVIKSQINFITSFDLGFDKNNLLTTNFQSWDNHASTIKQLIKNIPGVESVSITNWVPSDNGGNVSFDISSQSQAGKTMPAWFIEGDIDLANTLKFQLETGRLLDEKFGSDAINSGFIDGGEFLAFARRCKNGSLFLRLLQQQKCWVLRCLTIQLPVSWDCPLG